MNFFPAIAEHVRRNPALISGALETLDRWGSRGLVPVERLDAWRRILTDAATPAGFEALLALLLDESDKARRLKDYAPFAGALSREERRKVFTTCTYDH